MDSTYNKNAHYYVLLQPAEGLLNLNNEVLYSIDHNAPSKWVECEVLEDENSRLYLVPLEEGFLTKKIWRMDFLDSLRSGYIVEKTPEVECVREEWIEPLTNTVHLHHSAYVLKLNGKEKR